MYIDFLTRSKLGRLQPSLLERFESRTFYRQFLLSLCLNVLGSSCTATYHWIVMISAVDV